MTDSELQAIAERDTKSAPTWFTGPGSGPALCYRDRRALLLHALELRVALRWLHDPTRYVPALSDEALAKLDELLGVVKPSAPPIADFANRADPDEQQTEG